MLHSLLVHTGMTPRVGHTVDRLQEPDWEITTAELNVKKRLFFTLHLYNSFFGLIRMNHFLSLKNKI